MKHQLRARPPRTRRFFCISVILLAGGFGCRGRGGLADPDQDHELLAGALAVDLDLTRQVPEEVTSGGLFSLPLARSYPGLIDVLSVLEKSARLKGVLVRLGTTGIDFARGEELGRRLGALRDKGVKVVCHAHSYSNATLLLASRACEKLWVSPAGDVDAVGIAAQVLYLKGLLDRFKVKADFLHVGKYKSAAETLTEEGPSEAAKESLLGVLESMRTTWLDTVSGVRSREGIRAALEEGPYSSEAARAVGLIDEIGFASEAEQDLKNAVEAEEVETAFGVVGRRDAAREIANLIRLLAGARAGEAEPDRIALLVMTGGIAMEPSGMFSDGGIAHRPLAKALKRLREDESVKAVVLRINSPGGSALASDLLWHDLMELRKEKPVIASVGDMAASGGYYLASAAHQIFAERTSIVGSIGVVGGKLVFGEALEEYGVNGVTFAPNDEPGAKARAAYMSALTPWDEATRERIQSQMDHVYDLFLARVAEGRGLPRPAVHEVGQGRIWSGAQGKERNLVDQLGGLAEAIAEARRRAELTPDAPVDVEGAAETLLDLLALDESAQEDEIRAALARLRRGPALGWGDWPIKSSAQPFVAMLEPLIAGETALVIVPHGFAIE